MGSNDKKLSKAARRKKRIRILQAVIALILVLGMIVTSIIVSFGN